MGYCRAVVKGPWNFTSGMTENDDATMAIAGLNRPEMKIEIELTALQS